MYNETIADKIEQDHVESRQTFSRLVEIGRLLNFSISPSLSVELDQLKAGPAGYSNLRRLPQIRGRTTSIFLIKFIIFHRSLFLSFVQSEPIDGGKAEDIILSQVWIYNFGLKLVILTHKTNSTRFLALFLKFL